MTPQKRMYISTQRKAVVVPEGLMYSKRPFRPSISTRSENRRMCRSRIAVQHPKSRITRHYATGVPRAYSLAAQVINRISRPSTLALK